MNRKRILVVDDEMDHGVVISEVLLNIGCVVDYENLPTAALIRIGLKQPDLVVCDWVMPIIDGRQLLQAMRRVVPNIPVLVVSAWLPPTKASSRDIVLAYGATAFLAKPFNIYDLQALVIGILRLGDES
jgi:CheY-like chemotaxis protein